MVFRFRRLPALFSGLQFRECGRAIKLPPSLLIPLANIPADIDASGVCRVMHASRFSTVAARSKEVSCELDLISLIRSTFVLAEGPHHCWINRFDGSKEFLQKDGAYLLLVDAFLHDPPGSWVDRIVMLEKVKLLQQRYPWLQVFGFQSCSSVSSMVDFNKVMDVIMEEYITFPIFLSSKNFSEVSSGACCILFNGFNNPPLYNENDVDLSILQKAIKDLNKQFIQSAGHVDKLKSPWSKVIDGFKEPYVCSYLQNLPLFAPACISTDEEGNRFFLSDSNHHRVIVFDRTGKILDMIGSSPGYDDGEFETAKLMRPAASWYHASEDCLYLVDSENHAIRRADLGNRVLETLYPTSADKGKGGLWNWILGTLGLRRVDQKSDEFDHTSLLFPWHILRSRDNDLLVMNRSVQTLWVMDLDSGMVRDVVEGRESIMEFCGEQIMEKVSHLQGLSSDVLHKLSGYSNSLSGIPYSGFLPSSAETGEDRLTCINSDLLSSVVTCGEERLICDTVGQRVLMLNKQGEVASNIVFSNFGVLGLPYWLIYPLESVFPCGNTCVEGSFDHHQSFALLPGKTDIRMTIDIPEDTELVEPLHEQCVWRQTRGAALEMLGVETTVVLSNKVGYAQKWYDDLDALASGVDVEVSSDELRPRRDVEDGKVHIDCVVKTSPGTSEVLVHAPLYLKLRSTSKTHEDSQDTKAAKIADILKPVQTGRLGKETLIRLLLKLNRDLSELVFIKPLHVKIRFDTPDHPKAENLRDIILTESIIDITVSL